MGRCLWKLRKALFARRERKLAANEERSLGGSCQHAVVVYHRMLWGLLLLSKSAEGVSVNRAVSGVADALGIHGWLNSKVLFCFMGKAWSLAFGGIHGGSLLSYLASYSTRLMG